jgi:hypothetical protein
VKNYAHWSIDLIQGCWNFDLTLSFGEEMVVLRSYKMKSNVLGMQMWRHGFGNWAKGGAKTDWIHNQRSWDLVRTRRARKDDKKMECMIWNYWTQLGRNARNQMKSKTITRNEFENKKLVGERNWLYKWILRRNWS